MTKNFRAVIMSGKSEKVFLGMVMAFGFMMFAMPVYAAAPALITNAKALADAALTWILILVVPTAALMIGWQGVKKMMADGDPGALAQANKAMKNILIAGAIAASASGLAKVVLGFFNIA